MIIQGKLAQSGINITLIGLVILIFFAQPIYTDFTVAAAANHSITATAVISAPDPDALALTRCIDSVTIKTSFLTSLDLCASLMPESHRDGQHIDNDTWFRYITNPVTTNLVLLC